MRRDCKRLRSEKKSSSGRVFDVASFDEFFDSESVVVVVDELGLDIETL